MSQINDGGPAFGHGNHEQGGHSGMSLRDWFAGQAISGLISAGFDKGETVRLAYATADAMLAERAKGGGA